MGNVISLILKKITGENQEFDNKESDLHKAERIYQVMQKAKAKGWLSGDEEDLLFACKVFRKRVK